VAEEGSSLGSEGASAVPVRCGGTGLGQQLVGHGVIARVQRSSSAAGGRPEALGSGGAEGVGIGCAAQDRPSARDGARAGRGPSCGRLRRAAAAGRAAARARSPLTGRGVQVLHRWSVTVPHPRLLGMRA